MRKEVASFSSYIVICTDRSCTKSEDSKHLRGCKAKIQNPFKTSTAVTLATSESSLLSSTEVLTLYILKVIPQQETPVISDPHCLVTLQCVLC